MKFLLETKINKQKIADLGAIFLPTTASPLFDKLEPAEKKIAESFSKKNLLKDGETRFLWLGGERVIFIYAASEKTRKKSLILAIRKFILTAKAEKIKQLGIFADNDAMIETIVRESLVAHYDFSENYKTPPKGGFGKIEKMVLFGRDFPKTARAALRRGVIVGEAINRARTLANFPGGDMTPEGLAEAARELAMKNPELEVTVFNERKMEDIGMNAILAVGRGSVNPPRFITIEYGGGAVGEAPVAFVGKGITFDSGGLNIKPGDGMADMHLDMSGGAAVIAAMGALAELKIPVNALGVIAAAENMPSGLSYRQGDIIKAYGGKTIEIGNTDAEGRVVLADAIAYAKTKKPAIIITLATLTGASLVALGTRFSGLFVKNNKALQNELLGIGEESGDALWSLPLTDENERDVRGVFADLTNTHKNHSRYGGASTGAGFLSAFADGTPFAHIDMAPRMTANTDEENLAKGSVGFGVKLFLKLAEKWEVIKELLSS